MFDSISVVIPIQKKKKTQKCFPVFEKRKKKKDAHHFRPVTLFPSLVGNLDLLRERVCMVSVNIVGYI